MSDSPRDTRKKLTPEQYRRMEEVQEALTGGVLASSLGGAAATAGAGAYASNLLGGMQRMPEAERADAIHRVAGRDISTFDTPEVRNSFYVNPEQARAGFWAANPKDLDNGVIQVGGDGFGSKTIIAHEAGHAKNEFDPGLVHWLQHNVYPHSHLVGAMAPPLSVVAGMATRNPWAGALVGAGLGGLMNAGTILPEWQASQNAMNAGLDGVDGHALRAALLTYLAGGVVPSMLAGAFGGYEGRKMKWLKSMMNRKP